MHKPKLFITIIITLLISSTFAGCGNEVIHGSIYDSNRKIAKESDSYSYFKSNGLTKKEESSQEFVSFYGCETLWILDAKEDTAVNLKFKASIKNGKFKTVLITSDDKVTTIFEQDKDSNSDLKLKKGKNRIKIVGKDAKGSIELKLKADENVTVQNLDDL